MAQDYSQYIYNSTTYTVAKLLNRTGTPSFQKRYSCYACHRDFSRGQVMFFSGRPYGIPCGCSRDVAQLSK
jgi:hypothetical protein